MNLIDQTSSIGIVGAGTIGIEIAYAAISSGYKVIIYDVNEEAIAICSETLIKIFENKNEIQEVTQNELDDFSSKLTSAVNIEQMKNCSIIFEAIVDNERIKEEIYNQLEPLISTKTIIATTTSSLSVNLLASALNDPERFIGVHFLNPQFESKTVEVISGLRTSEKTKNITSQLITEINLLPIITQDSPGFISHRILSLFFLEALNLVNEGIADVPTIDWAMKSIGNFDLGPFEIIDMLGTNWVHQIIVKIYNNTYQNPKFRPSLKLAKMVEAKFLGRKNGDGFYNYQTGFVISEPTEEKLLGEKIYHRIMDTLCNEAFNLVGSRKVSENELETIIKNGLNFPIGLFEYAQLQERTKIKNRLKNLYSILLNDAHKPSMFLK